MAISRLNTLFKTVSSSSSSSIRSVSRCVPSSSLSSSVSHLNSSSPITLTSQFHSTARLRADDKSSSEKDDKSAEKEDVEESPKEELSKEEKKIQALQKEVDELKSKLVYSYAERENIRRISNIDVEKARDFGIQNFAKSLLDSADNFTRCLNSAPKDELEKNPAFKAFYEGVEMTEKILMKAFKNNGLDKFEPNTVKFDPNTMNALMFMPDASKENGFVGAVLKPGYILNKRVIRAADVGVVKNASTESEESS